MEVINTATINRTTPPSTAITMIAQLGSSNVLPVVERQLKLFENATIAYLPMQIRMVRLILLMWGNSSLVDGGHSL